MDSKLATLACANEQFKAGEITEAQFKWRCLKAEYGSKAAAEIEHLRSMVKDRNHTADFMWRWIDRMARKESSVEEALSVLTYYPDAPDWVKQTPSSLQNSKEGE